MSIVLREPSERSKRRSESTNVNVVADWLMPGDRQSQRLQGSKPEYTGCSLQASLIVTVAMYNDDESGIRAHACLAPGRESTGESTSYLSLYFAVSGFDTFLFSSSKWR